MSEFLDANEAWQAGHRLDPEDSEPIELLRAAATANAAKPDAARPTDERPEFRYEKGEGHVAVERAMTALADDSRVYQRAQTLVSVIFSKGVEDKRGIKREVGAPLIAEISSGSLWEILSQRIAWEKYDARAEAYVACDPPDRVVNAVQSRKQWPEIRELEGIVTSPVLRPDGSILDTPGYDAATRLLYVPAEHTSLQKVPEKPTRDDAVGAAAELLDVVVDVPFLNPSHRAAWTAALLSPIAWPGYEGGSPMFVFDAHTPGTGKSLSCDVVGLIASGRTMPRSPYVEDDDEMRKRITAHLLAGDALALIDNAPSGASIGWPSLDNALTGEIWRDRILGRSEIASLPMNVIWYATGNNLRIRADAARRVLKIRLEAELERPEERTGFKHDPLLPWVRRERPLLLMAALTILRAYFVAGAPSQRLRAMGSFDGWSSVVRSALVWIGLADPADCCASKDPDADPDAAAHIQALIGWRQADTTGSGMTAADVLKLLADAPKEHAVLRTTLGELCPGKDDALPTARRLGNKLRALKGRWRTVTIDGSQKTLAFVHATEKTRSGVVKWTTKEGGK